MFFIPWFNWSVLTTFPQMLANLLITDPGRCLEFLSFFFFFFAVLLKHIRVEWNLRCHETTDLAMKDKPVWYFYFLFFTVNCQKISRGSDVLLVNCSAAKGVNFCLCIVAWLCLWNEWPLSWLTAVSFFFFCKAFLHNALPCCFNKPP